MPRTVPPVVSSDPVRNLDSIRPTPVKAGLAPSDRVGPTMGEVSAEAVVRHYGSVKAAAISLRIDPSQLMRDVKAGKLACLDRDDDAKAFVANALREAFGDCDPRARRQRLLRDLRSIADALQEVI